MNLTIRTRRLCLILLLCLGYWLGTAIHRSLQPGTLIVGWGGRLQENTAEVVREAMAGGLRSVEIDVQVTQDGVPIGLHDPTLERETNATGNVSSKTWADFSTITRKSGKRVDRLDEILEALGPGVKRVFLDVRAADPHLIETPVRRSRLDEEKLTFCVFTDAQFQGYRHVFPSSEILFKSYRLPSEWTVDALRSLRHRGYDGLGFPMNKVLPSKQFVKALDRHDLKSYAWIVQTHDQLRELERLRIDYAVITGARSFLQ